MTRKRSNTVRYCDCGLQAIMRWRGDDVCLRCYRWDLNTKSTLAGRIGNQKPSTDYTEPYRVRLPNDSYRA